MQLFSSSKSQFTLHSLHSPNPNPNLSKSLTKIPIKALPSLLLLKSPPSSSKNSSQVLQDPIKEEKTEKDEVKETNSDVLLAIRRPIKEFSDDEPVGDKDEGKRDEELQTSSKIEVKLNEMAKKTPMFEPERVEMAAEEKPLGINLELALYRAKVLTRNFRFQEAEKILLKV